RPIRPDLSCIRLRSCCSSPEEGEHPRSRKNETASAESDHRCQNSSYYECGHRSNGDCFLVLRNEPSNSVGNRRAARPWRRRARSRSGVREGNNLRRRQCCGWRRRLLRRTPPRLASIRAYDWERIWLPRVEDPIASAGILAFANTLPATIVLAWIAFGCSCFNGTGWEGVTGAAARRAPIRVAFVHAPFCTAHLT